MKIIQLDVALRGALRTLEDQPLEVPEVPSGWVERTQKALDSEDQLAIEGCAREILTAHRYYPASWERKAWLDDLRSVTSLWPVRSEARRRDVVRG